jgi:SET domain-containing protein 6
MSKLINHLEVIQDPQCPLNAVQQTSTPSSFSIQNYHIQGSRILSRSFTVPSSRAGRTLVRQEAPRDVIGDPMAGNDDDDSDNDDEEEEREEQVMVPLADMLNAAYERDNVSIPYFKERWNNAHVVATRRRDSITRKDASRWSPPGT